MIFSEDSRVKIPCILHLVRLGYCYLSLKNAVWDEETNIFPDLFRAAIARINPGIECDDIDRLLADVKLLLDNEDLGKAFYEKLTERSGIRLIDFENFARTLLANRVKNAALILHDIGSKDERKQWVEDFKAGKIDLLFVYNMATTVSYNP